MLETLWERQVAFAHREVQGLGQDLETFLDLSRLSISGQLELTQSWVAY